jgi:hypothetical protein
MELTGGNLREAMGIEREVAFFANEPNGIVNMTDEGNKSVKCLPCESSNDLESLTTEVHLRLRSLDAVNSCFPSSP